MRNILVAVKLDSESLLDAERLAAMLKALSHPHRLRIFARLAACCPPGDPTPPEGLRACVGKVGEGLGIAPSTLSHHLKELRQAGLIRMERKGQMNECWVEPDVMALLSGLFTPEGVGTLAR